VQNVLEIVIVLWAITGAGLTAWLLWLYVVAPAWEFFFPGALARLSDRLLPLPPSRTVR